MIDVEVATIDGVDYVIVDEVEQDNTTYLYLSNVNDPDDVIIRKSSIDDKNTFIPLGDDNEYYLANLLFFKKMQDKNDD